MCTVDKPLQPTPSKQRGNVTTEWTVVTLVLVAALFAPIVGNGQSVMGLLMDSLQGFHKHSSFVLSLP